MISETCWGGGGDRVPAAGGGHGSTEGGTIGVEAGTIGSELGETEEEAGGGMTEGRSEAPPPALAELHQRYRDRHDMADRLGRNGVRVVGHIGPDLPRPLVTAAGAVPVRLSPAPRGPGGGPPPSRQFLGPEVAPEFHGIVDGVVSGSAGDHVVIDHSSDGSVRTFQALRWLVASGTIRPLHLHLLDLRAQPRASTLTYNRRQLHRLLDRLADWSGRRPDSERLRQAVHAEEAARCLLDQVLDLRRRPAPVLSAADAVAVIGAFWVTPVGDLIRLLRDLLAHHRRLAPVAGRRVVLVGGGPDCHDLYLHLGAAGFHVVAEDGDWGERVALAPWNEAAPATEAALQRHLDTPCGQARSSTDLRVAAVAERASRLDADLAISLARPGDPVTSWDRPALVDALRPLRVPVVTVDVAVDDRPEEITAAVIDAVTP
jgi:benzoyl-CoA reductase/2-hydroxyglutaryl-CoA dehydratase subunit BcrC/BadD/HgdB